MIIGLCAPAIRRETDIKLRAIVSVAGKDAVADRDSALVVEPAAKQRFDLVLMDCQLPDIDGSEAARLIRAEGASAGDSGIRRVSARSATLRRSAM